MSPETLRREFVKTIDSGGYSRRVSDKFRDFLELAYCTLAKPVYVKMGDTNRADELEAQYMRVVERYHEKDLDLIRETYPRLLGITINALHEGGDFLGVVAAELGALHEGIGQFFSPYPVSKMMAKMLFTPDDFKPRIKDNGYITLSEPACGAGGMVIAYAEILKEHNYHLPLRMLAHVVDVSQIAYWMSYIQLQLKHIPALVVHGNTLTLESWNTALTLAGYEFYCWHGHLFDNPSKTAKHNEQDETAIAITSAFELITDALATPDTDYTLNQLSLFGED